MTEGGKEERKEGGTDNLTQLQKYLLTELKKKFKNIYIALKMYFVVEQMTKTDVFEVL